MYGFQPKSLDPLSRIHLGKLVLHNTENGLYDHKYQAQAYKLGLECLWAK